jgi:glycosyltransferase involved in cell wall biosynthesis
MKLLILRGDLQSQAGYSTAIRAYCSQLEASFDRIVGVDVHFSPDRPFESFPHPVVSDRQARDLAAGSDFTLALSITTPDHYQRFRRALNVGLTFWETDLWPLFDKEESPWVARANRMDRLWTASKHAKSVFRKLGVHVPIRVIPWPVQAPATPTAGLPDGSVYDLDRCFSSTPSLVQCAAFQARWFGWSRRFARIISDRAGERILKQWSVPVRSIPGGGAHSLLCVAQDVPRKGLPLLLAEWLEFKRRPEAAKWTLLLKSKPYCPATPRHEFVARFWQNVQALKRQADVPRAGVYLWVEDMKPQVLDRLLANTFGSIVPSMGEGFCGPAAFALALKKPLVAPRHTSLTDYLSADYPYVFPCRPMRMRFVDDGLYGVHSTWHIAEPGALADSLSRVVTDSPPRREAAGREAADRLARWCRPERVRRLLVRELEQCTNHQPTSISAKTRRTRETARHAGC